MTNHTPGPWKASRNGYSGGQYYGSEDADSDVDAEASAAPDLLAQRDNGWSRHARQREGKMTGADDFDRRKDARIHALEAQLAILLAQRDELLVA